MKKLYLLLFAFSISVTFAQTKLLLKGKVYFENFPLQKIEIINLDAEKIVFSNIDGSFEILVDVGNKIVIGNSDYNYRTLTIKKEDLENKDFTVILVKKIEELDEVIITNIKLPKIKIDQATIDVAKLQKNNTFPNNINNQQLIPNGADLTILGREIGKLFKAIFNIQPKKPVKIIPKIDMEAYLAKNFKTNYLSETLNLKQDQIHLFFEFCKADSQYKSTFESDNVLLIMEFLNKKNTAFKTFSK